MDELQGGQYNITPYVGHPMANKPTCIVRTAVVYCCLCCCPFRAYPTKGKIGQLLNTTVERLKHPPHFGTFSSLPCPAKGRKKVSGQLLNNVERMKHPPHFGTCSLLPCPPKRRKKSPVAENIVNVINNTECPSVLLYTLLL